MSSMQTQVPQSLLDKLQQFQAGLTDEEREAYAQLWQQVRALPQAEGDVQGYQFGTYVVQPGDSLWSIAQKRYGNGEYWVYLYLLNGNQIADPNKIYPGERLIG